MIIEPVQNIEGEKAFGYVATLSRILPLLHTSGQFNLVDVEILGIDNTGDERIESRDLKPLIHYQINSDDYTDNLRLALNEAVIKLSIKLASLAQMILDCGHLRVAEGIENTGSVKQLAKLGFRYGQDCYFAKPVNAISLPKTDKEQINYSA